MRYLAIITLGIVPLLFSCKSKKEETVSPIESPVTEAVFASGHIEAQDQFVLTAFNDGYIKEVLVSEADNVTTGQSLYIQDNTTAAIQQQAAKENLQISQQQAAQNSPILQQLQAQLATARQKLQNDKIQLERMQRLYTTHSVAKVDLGNARLNYDNSENNVASILQNIKATKLDLKQTVINSRSQLQTATVNSNYYSIKSPGNYKVYSVLKKKGELVRKGEVVAVLGNAANLKIVLSIDESSISKIKLQQKTLVELNTDKGIIYPAFISKIYPSFDAASQSYTVEALLDTASTKIINGTLLQANIIVATRENAMLIPRSCLSADGKVQVKRKNATDTVDIRTGIVSNEWVEVLDGLALTDEIIKQ